MGPNTRKLIRRAGRRIWLSRLMDHFATSLLVLMSGYVCWMLVARLTGLLPGAFHLWDLGIIAVGAAAGAVVLARRPDELAIAHTIDECAATNDLYLTVVQAGAQNWGYADVVRHKAETAAQNVPASSVASWRGGRRGGAALALGLAALAGMFLLPAFDPFGLQEERRANELQREKLEKSRRETRQRLKVLRKEKKKQEERPEVDVAMKRMQDELARMKPEKKDVNRKRLRVLKEELDRLYKQRKKKQLADAMAKNSMRDRFGGNLEKRKKWKRDLEAGDSSAIDREIDQLKDLAEKLQKSEDESEKRKIRSEMKKRMEDLADFAQKEAGSKALSRAAERALEQLGASGAEGLNKEALEGLKESLKLSQEEIDRLAENLKDMKRLEQALQNIRDARALNQQGRMDGQKMQQRMAQGGQKPDGERQPGDAGGNQGNRDGKPGQGGQGQGQGQGRAMGQALQDMLAQGQCPDCGNAGCPGGAQCPGGNGNAAGQGGNNPQLQQGQAQGQQPGMGGPGQGRGGIAPEDEGVRTRFTPDLARSALTAGKNLLEWKERAVNAPGDAPEQYEKAVKAVKKGVDEAILHEQVPPGYHDVIKEYFDTMEGDVDAEPEGEE